MDFYHSVTLDSEKCKGCTNCIKRCPTEAIRVRNGKAHIITERCIDCGECIRVCPHNAKKAVFDSLDSIHTFRHKIALPAPSLYGQFNSLNDIGIVLNALKKIGFDEVFEVSAAAELVSDITRLIRKNNPQSGRCIISSACPAITRLIRVRFPALCNNVLALHSPAEYAARIAKSEAAKRTGLAYEDIGAFFISPCPAKVTATRMPIGSEKSEIDGVLAISDIYPKLLSVMDELDTEITSKSGIIGVAWATSGGEAAALLTEKYLAADGIENCINVLEELEDDKLKELEFVELNACSGGCVGGVLTVENPYVAKARIAKLRKYLPVSQNHIGNKIPDDIKWDLPLEYKPVLELAENVTEAIDKLKAIEEIESKLPGLDCGSCGAPSCRALAEDIIMGVASEKDCILRHREEILKLYSQLSNLDKAVPLPFRQKDSE